MPIDTAMQLGANHPMGPFALADFIGLDTCLSVMQVLYEGLADIEIPAVSAARQICRGRLARPQGRSRRFTTIAARAGADPVVQLSCGKEPLSRSPILSRRDDPYQAVTLPASGSRVVVKRWVLATVGLDNCPALVLNADFRPLSYFPLSVWSWQDAVKAVFLDRVNIIVSLRPRACAARPWRCGLPSVIVAQTYIAPARAAGLHPVQRVPARPLHLPVLRRNATRRRS